MNKNIEAIYQKMNVLSINKEPFFFIIDYEQKNAEVFLPEDIIKENILISFPHFSMPIEKKSLLELHFQAFPEKIEEYKKGFEHIQKHLHLGDTYLANYTQKTPISINYSLEEIYQSIEAKYKIKYKDKFVCFSPETFIEIKDNKISTHPMKGTIDAKIPNAKYILKENKKEKAEHYTVVDLLRNDLSIVAQNVSVKEFQRIDEIKTHCGELLGMSSEIIGELREEYKNRVGDVLKELLPAGSILGAPKQKTMQIISQAEKQKRGFYTGIFGYFDGQNLDSCVLIRFIEKENDKYYFRSGGGITHQSILEDEYQEMKNKIYVPIHRKY